MGNRLLSVGQRLPSVSLRAALQLADGAPVWEVRRQRLVNHRTAAAIQTTRGDLTQRPS